jgi:tetratricopeptide (TPR) repeat protein
MYNLAMTMKRQSRSPTRTAMLLALYGILLLPHSVRSQAGDPQQTFQQAVTAQQRGDTATALRLYRALLVHHPDTLVLRVNLAGLFTGLSRFDEAIEQYRAAERIAPRNRDVRLGLSYAYEGKGDAASLRRAAELLEALHASQPGDPQAALLLGDCYFHQQRYDQAVAILTPLESSHADDKDFEWLLGSALISSGQPAQGVRRIDVVASQSGAAEAYLLSGQTRLAMAQYDLALTDAHTAAEKDPQLAGVQTLLGMALERTGDYTDAKGALGQALAANPGDYDAQFYLGSLLFFERDLPGARQHIEQALRLRPGSLEARYKQALIEEANADSQAALADLEAIVRLRPDWLDPHVKLAALYFRLKRPEDGARERTTVDRLMAAHQGQPPPGP